MRVRIWRLAGAALAASLTLHGCVGTGVEPSVTPVGAQPTGTPIVTGASTAPASTAPASSALVSTAPQTDEPGSTARPCEPGDTRRRCQTPSPSQGAPSQAPPVTAAPTEGQPITVAQSQIDFGTVGPNGKSGIHFVDLTNASLSSYGPIGLAFDVYGQEVDDPTNPWSATDFNCSGTTLEPGQTCRTAWQFLPTGPGSYEKDATVTVSPTSSPSDTVTLTVGLKGRSPNEMAPLLSISSEDVTFPDTAIGTTATMPVTLTNVSDGWLGPVDYELQDFSTIFIGLGSNNCDGVTLQAGAACTIEYYWAPTVPVSDGGGFHEFTMTLRDYPMTPVQYTVDLHGASHLCTDNC